MQSNQWHLHSILFMIGRWFLVAVLLVAGIGKLLDPGLFIQFVIAVFNVSAKSAHIIFITVVNIEFIIALSLLFWGKQQRWPFLCSLILFVIFSSIIFYAMSAQLHVSCGCFGKFLKTEAANDIEFYRDVAFSLIALFLAFEKPSV